MINHSIQVRILITLLRKGELSFKELMFILNSTSGNIGSALIKLEKQKYIKRKYIEKQSFYNITTIGADAFSQYKNDLIL